MMLIWGISIVSTFLIQKNDIDLIESAYDHYSTLRLHISALQLCFSRTESHFCTKSVETKASPHKAIFLRFLLQPSPIY